MQKYVIERELRDAGSMSEEELAAAARTSNDALAALTPRVQWQESYITGDKVFCVFLAQDEQVIAEHASLSGFPATAVHRVHAVIDPITAGTRG